LAPGPCCFPDTNCAVLSYAACISNGGLYQGAGTTCTGLVCPTTTAAPTTTTTTTTLPPTGRCCLRVVESGNIVCTEGLTQAECDFYNFPSVPQYQVLGWTQGASCSPADVCGTTTTTTAAPTGRCCYGAWGDSSCSSGLTQSQCSDLGGTWAQGQTCAEAPCIGICCINGSCNSGFSPNQCAAAGGTFMVNTVNDCLAYPTLCATTTTTTSAPTTTTGSPSCGVCDYLSSDGVTWELIVSECTAPCNCVPPSNPPAFEGDSATTNCQ
jgi:hypothetical protein